MENIPPICRICFNTISDTERPIEPCNCRGSMQYVHKSCMELWLEESNSKSCSICRYRFRVTKTRRSFWEWLKSTESPPVVKVTLPVAIHLMAYVVAFCWFGLSFWLQLKGAVYFLKANYSLFRIVVVNTVFLVAVMKLFFLTWDFMKEFWIDFPRWREQHWHVGLEYPEGDLTT